MIDLARVRVNPDAFDAAMRRRGDSDTTAAALIALDDQRKEAIRRLETLRAERNRLADEIGAAKRRNEYAPVLIAEGHALRIQVEEADKLVSDAEEARRAALLRVPNWLDDSVPSGRDSSENRIVKVNRGSVIADHNRPVWVRTHDEIGGGFGMDFGAGAKLAGSRFTVLRGDMARLERALGQFMLNHHTSFFGGYQEVSVPLMVRREALEGTGQFPKFADDVFRAGDEHYLIPTAEVPLTNLVAGERLALTEPLRLAALTPCFRSEAGAAGRDTKGMLRQHQFYKVELVSITLPEDSGVEHERMTACAESVLTELGLTWRRVLLCAGDTGFSAAKTYDLEVYLPGLGEWREISSCSNCLDFQARRMQTTFKTTDGRKGFVHTLNGSGVAVGRALVAVLETHQREDGSVMIPDCLRPYFGQSILRS